MLPTQIFHGSPNKSLPRGYVAKYWEEQLYVIYGSGFKLVITDWLNQHVQSIDLNEDEFGSINCISLCSSDGKLAVACSNKVYIFKPSLTEKSKSKFVRWDLDTTIDTDSKITNLVWLDTICNTDLSLYQLYTAVPILEWSQSISGPVYIASASPDGLWLATISKDDPIVKIWSLKPDPTLGNLKMFSYIRHPKPVHNLEWKSSLTSDGLPLLFTTAKDGIFRCWSNPNSQQPYQFYLCTTIDPGQWSSSNIDSFGTSDTCKLWDAPFHWVDSGVVSELAAMESRRWKDYTNTASQPDDSFGNSEVGLTTLLELAQNPSPLLYQIQQDGALVVWRLEGLSHFPYTQPRALVVAKMFGTTTLNHNSTFDGYTTAIPNPRTLQLEESKYPAELSIFAQGIDGTIEHYTLGISQLLFSDQHGGEFYARTTWPSYQPSIRSIVPAPSPKLRFSSDPPKAVCLSEEGVLDLWAIDYKPDVAQPFYKPKLGLQFPARVKFVKWLDFEHLLVLTDSSCILYRLSANVNIKPRIVHRFVQSNGNDFGLVTDVVIKLSPSKTSDGSTDTSTYQILLLILDSNPSFHLATFEFHKGSQLEGVIEFTQSHFFNLNIKPNRYVWLDDDDEAPLGIISYDETTLKLELSQLDNNNITFNSINSVKLREVSASTTLQNLHTCCNNTVVLELKSNKGHHLLTYHIGGLPFGFVTYQPLDWNSQDSIVAISSVSDQSNTCTLAVASPTALKLFTKPVIPTNQSSKWVNYATIPTKSPSPLTNFALTWDGSAILQLESQLLFYGKWLPESTATLVPHSSTAGLIRTCHSLSHQLQRSLPHYHPAVINEFLRWGDFEITDKILDHLNAMIQHQDTFLEESVLVVPPLPLQTFFPEVDTGTGSDNSPDATAFLFSTGSEFRNRTLSEYQIKSLVEILTKLKVHSLSNSQQHWLCKVIPTLAKVKRLKLATDQLGFSFLSEIYIGSTQLDTISEAKEFIGLEVASETMVFALHSNSQDLLISECINLFEPVNSLTSFNQFGFAYWIQSDSTLRKEVEGLARNQYLQDKDPVKCSLLYLALDKKRLLLALWKTSTYHPEHQVMIKFLSNDFTLPRWQTAAMKNAFKLIGCQRYSYAAAFFLLAGKLKDAVNVCLRYLEDPTLAFMVCRCYQGLEGEETIRVIKEHLLPSAIQLGDRAKVSLLLWWLNLKPLSFQVLTCTDLDQVKRELQIDHSDTELPLTSPSLHLHRKLKSMVTNPNRNNAQLEIRLIVESVANYQSYGMPLLALYTLDQFQFHPSLPTFSPTLTCDEPGAMESEGLIPEPSPSDLWSWNPPKPTKRVSLLIAEGSKPITPSTPAIDSGLIDFDDWSWGNTQTKKPTPLPNEDFGYFDKPKATPFLNEVEDGTLNLPTDQLVTLNGLRRSLAYHLHATILEALSCTQLPSSLPKPILSEYLDDVKDGIQTLCQRFQLDTNRYDSILIQAILLADSPALGFDLLFQGILTNQPDPRPTVDTLLTVGALLLTDSLASNTSKPKLGTYVSAGSTLLWTVATLNQFPKWSVALRLESNNSHNLFQLQLTSLLLLILLLINSMRTRDFFKLAATLEMWNPLILAIRHDLDDLQLQIKRLVDTFHSSSQSQPLEVGLESDSMEFDLSHFRISKDLKLEFNGKPKEQIMEIAIDHLTEAAIFNKVLGYCLPPLSQLILHYRPDSKLSNCLVPLAVTILEPLLLLYKQLMADEDELALPFQLQEDLEDLNTTPHDAYLETKFKTKILELLMKA